MDTNEIHRLPLQLSRTQSNRNLTCSTDYSCDMGPSHLKTAKIPQKKQKLDAILNTIKSFKSSQSTSNLHSAEQLPTKYLNINNQSQCKGKDQSFIVEKRVPVNLNQVKEKSQLKYQLNRPSKNYLQSPKKEENSFSHQLKQVLSLDSLQKAKSNEINQNDVSMLSINGITAPKNYCGQKDSKTLSSLQIQKNSLEAIKQKLQKYGINISKNTHQSRLKLNQAEKIQKNNDKSLLIMKSSSVLSLKSSQMLSPDSWLSSKDKSKEDQQQKIQDQTSRPLTSLKQKNITFQSSFPTISNHRNPIQKTNSSKEDQQQKRISPLKSITSNNSMTSAKAHAKFFNFNMENFTGQVFHFGEVNTPKKPGSYGNNQKPKLTDSDQYGTVLKHKPGSYGNKKSLKSVFQPSSSFSKNSNMSSYEISDLALKQTIETECTYSSLHRKLSIKDFKLGRQIGKGKFGRVFICAHSQTGFLCAMKIIKKDMIRKQRNIEQLIRQVKIQMFLNHSNSVKMYGFFDDPENIYLLIEYCMEGQLYSLLKAKKRFQEDQAIPIIKDICEGLNHLHSQNIIHRDVKPENVVLSFQLSKLCDFGWSVNSQNEKRQTFCGTPLYVSPELLMGKTYDYKVDIWALGIMVYELLTGKLPFHITNEKQLRKIVTNEVRYPQHLSENARNFIEHLLQKNPSYRNDMETILKHKFLVQGLEKLRNKTKLN